MSDATTPTIPVEVLEQVQPTAPLIDVREAREYADAHVPGAVLMPMGQLPARLAELDRATAGLRHLRLRQPQRRDDRRSSARHGLRRRHSVAGGTVRLGTLRPPGRGRVSDEPTWPSSSIDTPTLGDRSYLVHDGEVAFVVDPQRDIDRVLALLDEHGVRLTHVFETHIHNDYVTGGLALARAHRRGVPRQRRRRRSPSSAPRSATARSSRSATGCG